MKLIKQLISIYLIVALVLGFWPAAFARAEGEEAGGETTVSAVETPAPAAEESATVETPAETEETAPAAPAEEAAAEMPEVAVTPKPESEPTSETIIETGDAISEGEIENIVNYNDLETGTSTVDAITATSTNTAEVDNQMVVTADTGGNAIEAAIAAYITTGDAVALANVLNLVNVNITNSNGWFIFLNQTAGNSDDLDFRTWLNGWIEAQQATSTEGQLNPCPELCGGEITVVNDNQATTTNEIVVEANTGENAATSTEQAVIETGDAYAAANLINVVNTNITDSNYLLLTFNNLGDWGDDLVLPPAELFAQLFNLGMVSILPHGVSNNNEANVTNGGAVTADTGGNTVGADGEAVIETGNAWSSLNLLNQINGNFTGFSSFSLLLQVHGDWSGEIFNAPPGLTWRQTPVGIELIYDPTNIASGQVPGVTSLENNNLATIDNRFSVTALTGDNRVDGGEAGLIETGDAYAAANVINVANTNVVGRNWLMAIVNVFGDWSGNIAFGRPDLWIGERVELSGTPLQPGGTATYYLTVKNNGDAPASAVTVTDPKDDGWFAINESSKPFTNDAAGFSWDLGTLAPGESTEVSYQVTLNDQMDYGEHTISNAVTVSSHETDNNPADNSDTLTLSIWRQPPARTSSEVAPSLNREPARVAEDWDGVWREPPQIRLTKTNDAPATITASSSVNYQVVLANDGQEAFEAVLYDRLTNPTGQVINEEVWELETIYPGEEITFDYTVIYNASSTDGVYTNVAWLEAIAGAPRSEGGIAYRSPTATSTVTIVSGPDPALLTASLAELANYESGLLSMDQEIDRVMNLVVADLDQLSGELALANMPEAPLTWQPNFFTAAGWSALQVPAFSQTAGLFGLNLDANSAWWLLSLFVVVSVLAWGTLPSNRQRRLASWFF